MPSAIETIVAAYVEHKNRMALDEMLRHRQRLLADLKSRTGFDMSLPIRNVSEDIAAIEAGLVQLRGEVPDRPPRRLVVKPGQAAGTVPGAIRSSTDVP